MELSLTDTRKPVNGKALERERCRGVAPMVCGGERDPVAHGGRPARPTRCAGGVLPVPGGPREITFLTCAKRAIYHGPIEQIKDVVAGYRALGIELLVLMPEVRSFAAARTALQAGRPRVPAVTRVAFRGKTQACPLWRGERLPLPTTRATA